MRSWMPAVLLALTLAGAGVYLGLRIAPRGAALAPPSPAQSEAAGPLEQADGLEALRAELALEIQAREQHEEEMLVLRGELATLGARLAETAYAEAEPEAESPRSPHFVESQPWFDDRALRAAGLDPAEVERLRGYFEETEMQRLYLRDRASREGWLGTRRYREELRDLEQRFRAVQEERGGAAYDWLLYAVGRPNRVTVRDVLERGPAREAGVETGDAILRYDGERIFSITELRHAISSGRAGELIPLDVERDAEVRRLYIPRGPLGVRLGVARAVPRAG
jgi:hypothetical protein